MIPAHRWTLELVREHRARGVVLVSRPGWTVGYAGNQRGTRLHLERREPIGNGHGLGAVVEVDPADGLLFGSLAEAELYALRAGRLEWSAEIPAG